MPIKPLILQRRHAELGRIRLGAKRDGSGAPMRLDSFRFTSTSDEYIRDLAQLYGGTPRPWDNNGLAGWEVYTDAKSIPVIAVKGGLSQWMETWSGGGCIHRCDGEQTVDGTLCVNDTTTITIKGETYSAHEVAKPTTRLSLMLPELEAIGVWRMETHGWNAAAEIPAVAELAQHVGDLVPAVLHLVERRAIRDGKTSRFVVPVLDLRIGAARLREIAAEKSGTAEIASPASPAVSGATSTTAIAATRPDYAAVAETLLDVDSVRDLWEQAKQAGHLDDGVKAALTSRVEAIRARLDETPAEPQAQAAGPPAGDVDGVVDAELVEPDADAVWADVVAAAGQLGMVTADLEEDVKTFLGGTSAAEASGTELQLYLEDLGRRESVPA